MLSLKSKKEETRNLRLNAFHKCRENCSIHKKKNKSWAYEILAYISYHLKSVKKRLVESAYYRYLFLDEQQFNEIENRTFWRFLRGIPLSGNFDKCLHGVPSWFGRILIWSIVRLLYNEFQWRFTITFEKAAVYLLNNLIKYGTRATRHIYFQSYHTC